MSLAERNLALLTRAGLADREDELRAWAARYGKPGYLDAAEAVGRLAEALQLGGGDLPSATAVADIFESGALAAAVPAADLVISDVPYGDQTSWQGAVPADGHPLTAMLESLCQVLPDQVVVAVCARTRQISFVRPVPALERFRIGHRAAFLGRVAEMRAAW